MSAGQESWKAQQTTDLVGSGYKLTVTGTVRTSNSSQDPELVEALPGINKNVLILDLNMPGGIGGTVMGVREVRFEKPVEPDQYSQVTIRRDGGDEVTIDVEVVHS